MFVRHSLKNLLRSWPKSVLFFLLLSALGVTLCIGVSLTTAIMSFLKECDENYTTIAVLEYIGVDYPDESRFDPDIGKCLADFDFSSLAEHRDVLNWDANAVALGSIAGKTSASVDPLYKDACVAVIYILSYNDNVGAYQFSIIEDFLHPGAESKGGYLETSELELQIGHLYLIHGRYKLGYSSAGRANTIISPVSIASAAMEGVDFSSQKMIVDVTAGGGDFEIPADSILRLVADTYTAVNNAVTVHATNDMDSLLPFQQSDLYVIEGRSFTQEECAGGARICLLPQRLAELLEVGVGDSIGLSLAVCADVAAKESYWAGAGFQYEDSYNIVGILSPNDDYRDTVFIPKSDGVDLSPNQYSYALGQVLLKNDRADHFLLDMQEMLPPRVRVNIYDQGYAAAAAPVRDVLRIAMVITAVCALTTLAILALFGFLFVYRQRGIAKTMRRNGASNGGIVTYFLSGSSFIALISAAAGAIASYNLSGYFMELVRRTVAGYGTDDLRYSNAALSISKITEFAPDIVPSVFALTMLALFVAAALACSAFSILSIRSINGRLRKRAPKKTSRRAGTASRSLRGGPLKYSWLSVCRGASRSFIPIVLCALATALLLQLTNATEEYEKSYAQLVDDTNITGYITNSRGTWRYGLLLDGVALNDFHTSGLLSEISITKTGSHYQYGIDPPEVWTSFTMETWADTLAAGPGLIWTNDLSAAQEFFSCTELPVTFMEGYDVSMFSHIPPGEEPFEVSMRLEAFYEWDDPRDRGPAHVIVSTAFLEQNDLSFGDTIELSTIYGKDFDWKSVQIVGSFIKQGSADNIYVPLSNFHIEEYSGYGSPGRIYMTLKDTPSSYVFDPDPDAAVLQRLSFSSIEFVMRGASELDAFKEYLHERGYSEVNNTRKIRTYITIEDKTFLATNRAMAQRLWYMQKIFPALYVLLILLAALIPFILIQMRKRETALMRAQGAAKHTAFFSVFFEQVMLCLPGVIIGGGVWLIVYGNATQLGVRLASLFAAFWLLGTGFSAFTLNRGSVRTVLKAEE